uniref:Uncharacterized protein n=1 Tax=Helianthus annuus TaxID=4232 RepID=A0A251U2I0_HELAN
MVGFINQLSFTRNSSCSIPLGFQRDLNHSTPIELRFCHDVIEHLMRSCNWNRSTSI